MGRCGSKFIYARSCTYPYPIVSLVYITPLRYKAIKAAANLWYTYANCFLYATFGLSTGMHKVLSTNTNFATFLMLKMSSRRTLNLSKNLMQMLVTWWFSITIGRILLHIIAQVVLNYNRVIILMFRLFFNFSSKFQLLNFAVLKKLNDFLLVN